PPPEDLAAYAKEKKMRTNVAQGDFDADGARDTAVLLLAPGDGKPVQYIAVCLDRKGGPDLALIRDPYCGDGLSLSPKRTQAYDFQTGQDVVYPTDGVQAFCFEKAGAPYLYRNGKFEPVVDGD